MNRNFILVFILLTTICMVNAIPLQKRSLEQCSPDKAPLDIKISPDPPVVGRTEIFTITGTLSDNDITDKSILSIFFGGEQGIIGNVFTDSVCGGNDKPDCPVNKGTQFTLTESSFSAPSPLPDSYVIEVVIGEGDTVYACEELTVGG